MKTITRRELYEKIWSITKAKTAKELNLSPTDLSRICNEHDIPSPTSGYWMHLGWGEDVEKTPLPHPENNPVIDLSTKPLRKKNAKTGVSEPTSDNNYYSEILDKELTRKTDEKELKKLRAQALAGKFIIDFQRQEELWEKDIDKVVKIYPVQKTLKSRRDIVLKTKAYFRLQRLSYHEQLQHPDYNRLRSHLNILTQENSYDRALRLFDSLISIYEALGGKMRYEEQKTSVEFANVQIEISIAEKNRRVPLNEEERRWGGTYKYVPSGMLRISIGVRWRGAEIEDSPYTKVEDKLDSVIKKTLSLVKYELDLREQHRLEEIERKKREEERRKEEERLRQLEVERNKERDHVRGMFKTLKREMIIRIIDCVLQNYGYPEAPANPDTATGAYVIKLLSLKNLFEPHSITLIDSLLTESDIDSLADEFFRHES